MFSGLGVRVGIQVSGSGFREGWGVYKILSDDVRFCGRACGECLVSGLSIPRPHIRIRPPEISSTNGAELTHPRKLSFFRNRMYVPLAFPALHAVAREV